MARRPGRAVPGEELVHGWRVVDVLGGGALTEVALVEDRHGARAVVKAARPGREERARRSLASEARILTGTSEPSLPRLLDADLHGAVPHLRLEHVDGPRLSSHVRREGPLGVGTTAALGVGLADALLSLHDAGVVHLDVKPGNVVLGRPPRLVDLGVARGFAEAALVRRPVGTRRWMAPEQRDPERFGGMGPEADVWGLAATLHLAVVGEGPFDDLATAGEPDTDGRVRRDYRVDPGRVADLRWPPHVPDPLVAVLSACLTWEPDDRPRMHAVRTALAELRDR